MDEERNIHKSSYNLVLISGGIQYTQNGKECAAHVN